MVYFVAYLWYLGVTMSEKQRIISFISLTYCVWMCVMMARRRVAYTAIFGCVTA